MAFSRAFTLLGGSGAGQLSKMVNQIAIAGLQGLSEAIAFGMKAGLNMEQVLEVIGKGAAQSWQMDNRGKTMIADKFDFGFAVDWMRKDLGLCLEEAKRNGARLPVTALVDQFYADVQAMGGRRWDTSSLIKRLRARPRCGPCLPAQRTGVAIAPPEAGGFGVQAVGAAAGVLAAAGGGAVGRRRAHRGRRDARRGALAPPAGVMPAARSSSGLSTSNTRTTRCTPEIWRAIAVARSAPGPTPGPAGTPCRARSPRGRRWPAGRRRPRRRRAPCR